MVISCEHLPTWILSVASVPERVTFLDEDSVTEQSDVLTSSAPPERESTVLSAVLWRPVCFFSWLLQLDGAQLRIWERRVSAICSQTFRRANTIGRTLFGLLRRYSLLFGGKSWPWERTSPLRPLVSHQNPLVPANSLPGALQLNAGFFCVRQSDPIWIVPFNSLSNSGD